MAVTLILGQPNRKFICTKMPFDFLCTFCFVNQLKCKVDHVDDQRLFELRRVVFYSQTRTLPQTGRVITIIYSYMVQTCYLKTAVCGHFRSPAIHKIRNGNTFFEYMAEVRMT